MKQILLMIAVVELAGCVSTHTGATAKKDEARRAGNS